MLPSLPTPASAMFSSGLAMGGSGEQLVVQVLWLLFVVGWSLLVTVPVCLVLMVLGAHPCIGETPWSFSRLRSRRSTTDMCSSLQCGFLCVISMLTVYR